MHGLGGRVLDEGEIVVMTDVRREPNFRAREYAELLDLVGAVAVPIYIGERLGAVAEFFSHEPLNLDTHTRGALSRVSSTLGMALSTIPDAMMSDGVGS